jgi:ABC-type nitrate/sulfonate/bicarbonate transport system permease component
MKVFTRLLPAIALPAVLVAIWWVFSAGSTNPYFPPLSSILEVFPATWGPDRLVEDVLPSLIRLVLGYSLVVFVGVLGGTALGRLPSLYATLNPVWEFFRALPAPVLIPALILIAGIGDGMKILVIALGCLWPILLNTVAGVRAVDEVVLDTARCYGYRRGSVLMRVILPSASPQIIAGMRQSLSIGIILVVISEMFASSNGLGFTVVQFQRGFAIPQMWTGIIVLGLFGVILSLLFKLFERQALAWYLGLRQSERGR